MNDSNLGTRPPVSTDPAPDAGHASRRALTDEPTVIRGDRFCRGCGVNLIGTPVEREAHYGLMVATCPGCGEVTPMVVYPHLGRWTTRWAGFFAGSLLLVLILVLLGGTAMLVGMDYAIADEASRPIRWELQSQFEMWLQQRDPNNPNPRYWNHTPEDLAAWIEQGGITSVRLGSLLGAIGPEEVMLVLFGLGMAYLQGVILAVLMMRANRRQRLLVTGCSWALVMIVGWLATAPIWTGSDASTLYAILEANLVWPLWMGAQVITFGLAMVGVLTGRMVARGVVRALLSPGHRAALAVLWTTDGMRPPRA